LWALLDIRSRARTAAALLNASPGRKEIPEVLPSYASLIGHKKIEGGALLSLANAALTVLTQHPAVKPRESASKF